jgi:hypothetical protein
MTPPVPNTSTMDETTTTTHTDTTEEQTSTNNTAADTQPAPVPQQDALAAQVALLASQMQEVFQFLMPTQPPPNPQGGQQPDSEPTQVPIPAIPATVVNTPMVPLHHALAQFRRYDGKADAREFVERFIIDLTNIGYGFTWAIHNFDRVLESSALDWWHSNYQLVQAASNNRANPRIAFNELMDKFTAFFSKSLLRNENRRENKNLTFKYGDNPQNYVTEKLEVLRYMDSQMDDERKVEQLLRGLPKNLRTALALHTLETPEQFLAKLSRATEYFDEPKPAKKSTVTDEHKSVQATSEVMAQVTLPQQQQQQQQTGSAGNQRRKPRPYCEHCRYAGHNIDTCWKLHPHLRPQRNVSQPRTQALNEQIRNGLNPPNPLLQTPMPQGFHYQMRPQWVPVPQNHQNYNTQQYMPFHPYNQGTQPIQAAQPQNAQLQGMTQYMLAYPGYEPVQINEIPPSKSEN